MTEASKTDRAELAVVLALPSEGAAPLDVFAGLPLALRTVLTVQKEGAKKVFLLGPEGEALAERFAGDARVKVPLRGVQALSAKEGLLALRAELDAPFLVGRHDVILDPSIYRALAREPLGDALAVVSVHESERLGPLLAAPALLGELAGDDGGPGRASAPSPLSHRTPHDSLDLKLTHELAAGRARRFEAGAAWWFRVATPEGKRLAFRALFEACRKPVDGFVARNLNRHISIFISKRMVGLPFTPNQLSVLTFLLGVAGAALCARGGYVSTLAGAFLFQWNSILDGVDGELARVRFQHSKLGQWLDTVSDDTSNVIFYAGLALGAEALPHGRWLALAGWIAIVTFALASAQFYVEMASLGTGDLYAIDWGFDKAPPPGFRGKVIRFFRVALKKDFAILFFLFLALCGVLPYALPIIAGASIGNLIAATVRNVRRRRAR